MTIHAKLEQIKALTSGIWLRKKMVLSLAFFATVIGCSVVMFIPNKYESNAKVYADTKSLLKPLLQGMAVQGDSDEDIRIIAQNLLSKPNLEKIAQQSGLHLRYTTPESYEIFLINFQKEISLVGSKKQNLFTISYKNADPKLAKRVVELTLQSLVDSTVGQSRQDNSTATEFLNTQILEQKKKLELAEKVLAQFKQRHQDVLPQRGNSYFQEVSQLRQMVDETRMQLSERNASLASLKSNIVSGSANNEQMQKIATPFDARIDQLEQAMVNLEVRYTNKHPDIQEISGLLSSLKKDRAEYQTRFLEQVAEGKVSLVSQGSAPAGGIDASSQIMLLTSDIDALNARLSSLESRLAQKVAMLEEIPQIEAELTSLTRDYNSTNDLYQNLLQRRDSAELSRNVSENTSEIKFRVIEPPSEPLLPSGPPRAVMYVIVLLMSFSFSVGFAFLLSQIRGTVQTVSQISKIVPQGSILTPLPDFSASRRGKRKTLLLSAIIVVSLIGMVVLLVLHEAITTHSPIFWLRGIL